MDDDRMNELNNGWDLVGYNRRSDMECREKPVGKINLMCKRYMMATKACHLLGDISRDVEDVCIVDYEDDEYYYGEWLRKFVCMVHVQFPKSSTRDLTGKELTKHKKIIDGFFINKRRREIQSESKAVKLKEKSAK